MIIGYGYCYGKINLSLFLFYKKKYYFMYRIEKIRRIEIYNIKMIKKSKRADIKDLSDRSNDKSFQTKILCYLIISKTQLYID